MTMTTDSFDSSIVDDSLIDDIFTLQAQTLGDFDFGLEATDIGSLLELFEENEKRKLNQHQQQYDSPKKSSIKVVTTTSATTLLSPLSSPKVNLRVISPKLASASKRKGVSLLAKPLKVSSSNQSSLIKKLNNNNNNNNNNSVVTSVMQQESINNSLSHYQDHDYCGNLLSENDNSLYNKLPDYLTTTFNCGNISSSSSNFCLVEQQFEESSCDFDKIPSYIKGFVNVDQITNETKFFQNEIYELDNVMTTAESIEISEISMDDRISIQLENELESNENQVPSIYQDDISSIKINSNCATTSCDSNEMINNCEEKEDKKKCESSDQSDDQVNDNQLESENRENLNETPMSGLSKSYSKTRRRKVSSRSSIASCSQSSTTSNSQSRSRSRSRSCSTCSSRSSGNESCSSNSSEDSKSSLSSINSEHSNEKNKREKKSKITWKSERSKTQTQMATLTNKSSAYANSDYNQSRSHHSQSPHKRVRMQQQSSYKQAYRKKVLPVNTKDIEDRKIIYVGKIPDGATKTDLRHWFGRFGPIKEVSVHFRDFADNYAFVTYYRRDDACEALEHANDDKRHAKFDLSFGGRRQFCKEKYEDLDYAEDNVGLNGVNMDFDSLLRSTQAKLTR